MLESPRRQPLVLPYDYRGPGFDPSVAPDVGALLVDMPAIPFSPAEGSTDPTAVSVPLAAAPTHSDLKAHEASTLRLRAVNAAASDVASTAGTFHDPPEQDEKREREDPICDRSRAAGSVGESAALSLSTSAVQGRDVDGLRKEVERLRREVKAIRAEQPEAPPGYVSDEE